MSRPQSDSRIRGLSCPSCGGSLDVAAGLRVIDCPFCDTPLLALSELGLRRWAVLPTIESGDAKKVARDWLSSGWKRDRRLRDQSAVGEAILSFLPFFRLQADALGFALGTEERRRTVGSGKRRRTETYEVDVERSVEKSFDRTYPALDVAEWGVQRIDLRDDELVPFDSEALKRLGMVFPPLGSETEIKEAALQQLARQADPGRGLKRVRFRFLETLRERFSVIYYPLWIIRYRFADRSYQILVDAEDGSLVYGKAPGNDLYRAVMMVLSQAAALFVATTLLRFIGINLGGLAVVGAAVVGVLVWGWKRFRHGGVVIEGTGVGSEDTTPEWLSELGLDEPMREMVGDLIEGRRPRPDLWI